MYHEVNETYASCSSLAWVPAKILRRALANFPESHALQHLQKSIIFVFFSLSRSPKLYRLRLPQNHSCSDPCIILGNSLFLNAWTHSSGPPCGSPECCHAPSLSTTTLTHWSEPPESDGWDRVCPAYRVWVVMVVSAGIRCCVHINQSLRIPHQCWLRSLPALLLKPIHTLKQPNQKECEPRTSNSWAWCPSDLKIKDFGPHQNQGENQKLKGRLAT